MAAISTFIAAASVGATLAAGNMAKKSAKNQQSAAKKAQDDNLAQARKEASANEARMRREQEAADAELKRQEEALRIQREQQRQQQITAQERRLLDPTAADTDTRVALGTNAASDKLLSRGRKKSGVAGSSAAAQKSAATKVGGL